MVIQDIARYALLVGGIALMSACATRGDEPAGAIAPPPTAPPVPAQPAAKELPADPAADKAKLYPGSGVLVRGQIPGGALPMGDRASAPGQRFVLNFEGADLREVIRNILGEILNESYTIDSSVGGQVTLRTSTGIPREALPATLEMLLRMNGASMVREGGIYKILPQAAAVRGNVTPQLGSSNRALPPGFSVQIIPLRFVGVREMLRLLEPFAKDAQAVRVDELRNLMILSGTERELRHLIETIDMFDVDWMAGMSAGVFVLQSADVKSVMQELDKLLGDKATSPLTGILKIVPIERMNALLVITPQPAYLDEVRMWIARLDQGGGGDAPRFFVYHLQNQRAEKLGPLLQQAFTGRAPPAAAAAAPTLAPGTPAGQIVNPPTFQTQPAIITQPQTVVVNTENRPSATATAPSQTPVGAGRVAVEGVGVVRNLQVVADKDNNTLLIVATPLEYTIIEAALRKLDVPARQVLMDVTIAEITLTDDIDFGIDWLFKGGAPSGRGSGGLIVGKGSVPTNPAVPSVPNDGTGSSNPILALAQGFTYIINNANFPGGVQAVRLMDQYGNTKVIANPRLAALDNQKATIKSGERIPINQQTAVSGTTNGFVTTTSQYIDTGVLMQVTPHINAGGLVTLDVQAEVSNPGNVANPGDAPPINTRSVQTIVSVQSGQTMVMGGLINEVKQISSAGLPLLARIPYLGGFFGQQKVTNNRTELVMFITPRVMENEQDIRGVIDELRKKMTLMDQLFPVPNAP
jgi:general secretion pathway protein D